MNSRVPALFPAALVALLAGCASAPAPTAPAAAGPASTAAAARLPSGPEATLQKGMTAAMVKRIMGEPGEVRPMNSPAGKAETWVYHRTTRGPMQQIVVGSRPIDMAGIGTDAQAHVMGRVEEPIIRQETPVIEETINLLMFDDQFIEQSKSVRSRLEYQ
ncbi:MAG TPA: hypothetical protein VLT83_12340 [Opitutaceae bacterium]|nr:hypothetical protein [Opitutaceae bacterium]